MLQFVQLEVVVQRSESIFTFDSVCKYGTVNNLQRTKPYVLCNYTMHHRYTVHRTTVKHIVSSVLKNKVLLKYSRNNVYDNVNV